MPVWMTVPEYARSRGASEAAVRYQIRRGNIHQGFDGRVDREQADAVWQTLQGRSPAGPAFDRARRRVDAAALAVRIGLSRAETEALASRYVERDAADAVIGNAIAAALQMIRTSPARYAGKLAAAIEIEPAVAESLLRRAIETALVEIGKPRDDLATMLGAL